MERSNLVSISDQNGCKIARILSFLLVISHANWILRNFVVKKVARLILQKTLVWEGKQTIKDCEASAASKREGVGRTLILYIGDNMQRDFYEWVACRFVWRYTL